ncbi:MAG: aspartate aminotransferase family protein [Acidaminobacteraceae bacterium]
MSKNLAPNNNVFYRTQNWHYPKIVKGEGIYLIDENGRRYLDGCSGSSVANIGHGNKEIAEHAKNQIEKIAFTHLSRFTAEPIEKCAKLVAKHAPEDLNHVYFVSGGSEAVETSIKMARQYYVERDGEDTSKYKVISKWNSFHGNTLGALSLTGIPGRRKIYDPMLINFPKVDQFYHYRNPWQAKTLKDTSRLAAKALEDEIQRIGSKNIAAFISEPIVGSAAPGVHPDKIYFDLVREICDKHDILLIIDEVMSGFGRTGKWFAIEHYGLNPDILVTAKGMSCGYTPIGSVIASDKVFGCIMQTGSGNFIHGHTYGGNPLSCSIAAKVIEMLERDNIIANAKEMGDYLYSKLEDLKQLSSVGDLRGLGLMIGIEFVKNKETKEAFSNTVNFKGILTQNCMEEGLVIYPGGGTANGSDGDHILITPPLNITKNEIDSLVEMLKTSIIKTEEMLLWKN